MTRYIDADALMSELLTMYKSPTSTEDFMTIGYDHAIADVVVTVHQQPTADAVPVVRCRECKWWGDIGCAINIVDESDKPKEDDFCSFGERREDVRKPDSDDF